MSENEHDQAIWIARRTRIELANIVPYAENPAGFSSNNAWSITSWRKNSSLSLEIKKT